MSSFPVIGISAYAADAAWGSWHQQAALLPTTYVRSVERAGGAVSVLPVGANTAAVVARIDALVLAGGPDVHPALYHAEQQPATKETDPERDASEMACLREALERRIPVLAICRGMQLLNVARGGTLHQHLPDVVATDRHLPKPGVFGEHSVRVRPGSTLASVLGTASPTVSCHHHQGVDHLGADLESVAWGADGTVEALECAAAPHLLAVQWHPEQDPDSPLFSWLVSRAKDGAS